VRRREITERFINAATSGDLEGLTALLSDGVTLVGDGGGKARAPLRVLVGQAKVGRFLTSAASPSDIHKFMGSIGVEEYAELTFEVASVNGGPAAVISTAGRVVTVISLVVVDGRIDTIYLIANPEKMAHLHQAS
jgi:RNA polymerase sigma-70 factor (ECF subfamily)